MLGRNLHIFNMAIECKGLSMMCLILTALNSQLIQADSTYPHSSLESDVNEFRALKDQRMAPKVEKLPIPVLPLGEGPHWSTETESLYLVDIIRSTIHRYHPSSEKHYSVKLDVPSLGFVVPVSGNKDQFLVGAGTTLYTVKWDGVSTKAEALEVLCSLSGEPSDVSINDGKCDPFGRVWFGTMRATDIGKQRDGSFFSYNKEKGLTKQFPDVGISNGMAWDLKKNRMYYIDSLNYSVDAFDYKSDGTIGNRRVVFDFKKNGLPSFPDGMTIDTDGNIWVACFSGSQVIKVDPEANNLLDQIPLPTSNITSVVWGGKHLNELFVTSAGSLPGWPDVSNDISAGATFRVTELGARGSPMTNFKLE